MLKLKTTYQVLPVGGDLSLVSAVGGVVLEHVDHVVEGNEGVVDGHDVDSLLEGSPQDETTDASETVDTDLGHGENTSLGRSWSLREPVGNEELTIEMYRSARIVILTPSVS